MTLQEAINKVEEQSAQLAQVDGLKAQADDKVLEVESKLAVAKTAQSDAISNVNTVIGSYNSSLDELAAAITAAKRTPITLPTPPAA